MCLENLARLSSFQANQAIKYVADPANLTGAAWALKESESPRTELTQRRTERSDEAEAMSRPEVGEKAMQLTAEEWPENLKA